MILLFRILWYAASAGTITSSIYCAMVLGGATRFAWRRRREEGAPVDFLPPVSVLKPLHGAEPDLAANLQQFFTLDYPDYELLFCARHPSDEGLQIARSIAAACPHVKAKFIACGEPRFPNAKMWSLAFMAEHADYDIFVASDADARVTRDYLLRCVPEMKDPRRELASCLYIGETSGGFAAQLDAVGKSVEMSGGVLVAEMLEGSTRFALGVSMVLRRGSFEKAGGYEELGQFQAEDFVLGKRLAERGYGVRMADYVVRLMVLPQGLRGSFRDQLRWMKSTRRSRPAGHLGTGLTYAVPFGALGLAWGLVTGHALAGLFWLLAICVSRWLMAAAVLWALGEKKLAWPTLIYPVRDALGFAVWVASYLNADIVYHDATYSLAPDGQFTSIQKKQRN